jgi:hypothetical protein
MLQSLAKTHSKRKKKRNDFPLSHQNIFINKIAYCFFESFLMSYSLNYYFFVEILLVVFINFSVIIIFGEKKVLYFFRVQLIVNGVFFWRCLT